YAECDQRNLREPYRPALGQRATDDFSFEASGGLVGFPPGDDSGMRKVIEPTGVIVMEMGQNDRLNVTGGIEVHSLKARADFFQRSHPNDDLLHEKRIPPRKIARNGVSCRISGIDEEPPLGMFDEKAKDRHGSHPLGIAKDVDLPLKCRSSLSPALLGSFQLRRACLNGCDVDHKPGARVRPVKVTPRAGRAALCCDSAIAQCGVCRSTSRVSRSSGRRASDI